MKMHGEARWEDVEEENYDEDNRTESGDGEEGEEAKGSGKDEEDRAELQVVQKDYDQEEKKQKTVSPEVVVLIRSIRPWTGLP